MKIMVQLKGFFLNTCANICTLTNSGETNLSEKEKFTLDVNASEWGWSIQMHCFQENYLTS